MHLLFVINELTQSSLTIWIWYTVASSMVQTMCTTVTKLG